MFGFGLKNAMSRLEKDNDRLKKENDKLIKLQFREGDLVYINDGCRSPLMPFYLRKAYNNGQCYYVTRDSDGVVHESLSYAVNVSEISHKKPDCCKACGNQI